jgi:2-polyprenyl-6-methoxyphenol hydroxylase-like FAD-dependent oxidoreductase
MSEEKATLAESDVPAKGKLRFGFQAKGVERSGLRRLMIQTAKDHGVEIHWEHSLVSLEQGIDEVRLKFENGHTDTASFVIGCDGIHSNTRASIFGHEKADFTGFTQVCRQYLYISRSLLDDSEDGWFKPDSQGVFGKILHGQHLFKWCSHGRLSYQHNSYRLGVSAQLSCYVLSFLTNDTEQCNAARR